MRKDIHRRGERNWPTGREVSENFCRNLHENSMVEEMTEFETYAQRGVPDLENRGDGFLRGWADANLGKHDDGSQQVGESAWSEGYRLGHAENLRAPYINFGGMVHPDTAAGLRERMLELIERWLMDNYPRHE